MMVCGGRDTGLTALTLLLLAFFSSMDTIQAWREDTRPNLEVHLKGMTAVSRVQRFGGNETATDDFRILLAEGDHILVGARNVMYNISMVTLTENARVTWYSSSNDMSICKIKGNTEDQCQNYIRVITKISPTNLLVCGTNSYKPWCRTYRYDLASSYVQLAEDSGIAKCPYDKNHNSTAIYVDGRLYSATIADMNSRDPLIYSRPMRTEQHDSQWLNAPDFVSSFDYADQVYFFFRETAVEYINCGKAIYSRVGRVCKKDQGGSRVLRNTWTSFFKSRLNCSIPGEFPFYFDEIQSTSQHGQGNFMPTKNWENRTDMIYGVFTTPQNSISGSAVCAFRFSDILKSFEGPFKEQRTAHSSWMPVNDKDTPHPHPANTCVNDSTRMNDQTLNFIKSHPLMDTAVPAFGGSPIVIQTSTHFRFTQIAVDWQVLGADKRYYDVLYIGTDDGHVIKAINRAVNGKVETTVIEDIRVFDKGASVDGLKVFRNLEVGNQEEKLIVISKDEIKAIPLHRCNLMKSCRECVALQDPYCSWTDKSRCENHNVGLQELQLGKHDECPDNQWTTNEGVQEPAVMTTNAPCICPPTTGGEASSPGTTTERSMTVQLGNNEIDESAKPHRERSEPDNHIPMVNYPDPASHQSGPQVGASTQVHGAVYTGQTLAIATVIAIVMSLFVGFLLGYRASVYRQNRRDTDIFNEHKLGMRKSINRFPDNSHNFNHMDHYSQSPEKQLNVVFNPLKGNGKLPNGSAETKVQPHKVKKVYL